MNELHFRVSFYRSFDRIRTIEVVVNEMDLYYWPWLYCIALRILADCAVQGEPVAQNIVTSMM